MKWLFLVFVILSQHSVAQEDVRCNDSAFDEEVRDYLKFTVPVVDVDTLGQHLGKYVILDTRSLEEYNISHIPGAHYIGYKDFDQSAMGGIPKSERIVVYCSIGYRSEKVGEKLQKLGYTNVFNLYGSIFEWANHGYPLMNSNGQETDTLHSYSRNWSKWISAPNIVKTW